MNYKELHVSHTITRSVVNTFRAIDILWYAIIVSFWARGQAVSRLVWVIKHPQLIDRVSRGSAQDLVSVIANSKIRWNSIELVKATMSEWNIHIACVMAMSCQEKMFSNCMRGSRISFGLSSPMNFAIYWHGLNLVSAWISIYVPSRV